jgi:L-ascorbate 6-phosphate lactonase
MEKNNKRLLPPHCGRQTVAKRLAKRAKRRGKMDLAAAIREVRIKEDELAIFWIGQAGFVLVDGMGRQLAIDLYLTDCGERIRGFKRLSPKLLSPTELEPDYYLITHTHFDHLDYDAIPLIATGKKTVFCGPSSCIEALHKNYIREEQCILLNAGDKVLFDGVKVTAVKADHGSMSPDAVGFVVEIGKHCIYFAGDTCYLPQDNELIARYKPDVAVICINGQFGNMNAVDAGKTAMEVGAKLAIPCHFWTFAEHQGNPKEFIDYLEKNSDTCKPKCMRHGEMLII